jgi:hypothetical protein
METKENIIKILNCFETGSTETDYYSIFIYRDGPNKKTQLTLGRGYTECGGALWKVFQKYKELGGEKADMLLSYRNDSCKEILPKNKEFISLIINTAKTDKKFRDAQDMVYDELYWNRGLKFFNDNGFTLPLSLAVIQDSILHSGSILDFLRKRFSEKTPNNGGDEKKWIEQYVNVRFKWLFNHPNTLLRNTIYRQKFFTEQIKKNNWQLDQYPIYPNGVKISG